MQSLNMSFRMQFNSFIVANKLSNNFKFIHIFRFLFLRTKISLFLRDYDISSKEDHCRRSFVLREKKWHIWWYFSIIGHIDKILKVVKIITFREELVTFEEHLYLFNFFCSPFSSILPEDLDYHYFICLIITKSKGENFYSIYIYEINLIT